MFMISENESPAEETEPIEIDAESVELQDEEADPQVVLTAEEQEIQAKIEEMRIEFGEVTDVMVDAAFDENVADFLIAAEEEMTRVNTAMNGKARFYLHREPNGDLYMLVSPRHQDWNTAWVAMIDPRFAQEAFAKYGDELLEAIMLYPTFEKTDWEYEGGEKMNTPMGLTRSRLVGTFLQYEIPDGTAPNDVTFTGKEVSNAVEVAKRKRVSL